MKTTSMERIKEVQERRKSKAYNFPKNAKFCMCFKIRGIKKAFDLIDLAPAQAKWFLAHYPDDYYFINEIGPYYLINVFLDKTGI